MDNLGWLNCLYLPILNKLNSEFSVEEIIPIGNTVVTKWHLTGTHRGEYLGQAATEIKVKVDGVGIDQIENGIVALGFDA